MSFLSCECFVIAFVLRLRAVSVYDEWRGG